MLLTIRTDTMIIVMIIWMIHKFSRKYFFNKNRFKEKCLNQKRKKTKRKKKGKKKKKTTFVCDVIWLKMTMIYDTFVS